MTHSLIAKKDLDSEMTVVRNEFEMGENSPGQRVARARAGNGLSLAQLRPSDHRCARRYRGRARRAPAQASITTTISRITPRLIVTGKFEPKATLDYIQKVFGAIPKPTRILPNLYTAEPPQDGMREVTLRRSGGAAGAR